MNEINQVQLEQFRKLGLIDEIELRNYYIRKDFEDLREKGIQVSTANNILSIQYRISECTINIILYKCKNGSNIIF
jgi:hypothetical protein